MVMNKDALQLPVSSLKGIGEKTSKLYEKCGIERVEDLLYYYPRNYDVLEPVIPASEAKEGTLSSFQMVIMGAPSGRYVGKLNILSVKAGDASGFLNITFFNMPYLRKSLKPRETYVFRGIPVKKGNSLILQQPKIYSPAEYDKIAGTMQPRYSLVKGLTNHSVSKAVKQALEESVYLEDTLPTEILDLRNLEEYKTAIRHIHFPQNIQQFQRARDRLSYEEFFDFVLRLRFMRESEKESINQTPMVETADTRRLIEQLPFSLTDAQMKVWGEIKSDLCGPYEMNRLIQGDVGSGKTILAFLALLLTCSNGYQGAMMAPTEVLARQHFAEIELMSRKYQLPIKPVLLIGALSAKEKREARDLIAYGNYNVIIGTNALMQEAVHYHNLALVITDEQHRFGVKQREKLSDKGIGTHVLAMSATPIPRTLAMILYGDLHISIVNELPVGRLPIKNTVVGVSYRKAAYKLIADQVAVGRQAYVICPMIEEGEMDGVENVTDYAAKLSAVFPSSIRIGVLHGKMKPAMKDEIMESFAAGNIDVLVSTTVIEVGINVPNATVMMIENAEHFGLAQLHQLRGRVGRGKEQSYCIFMNTSEKEEAQKRLEILKKSNDGFAIAEEDLKQRGPGDLFGIRQSGDLSFQVGDIYRDADLLKYASEDAQALLASDPMLEQPENLKLKDKILHFNQKGLIL